MKKFIKILIALLVIVLIAGGSYYIVRQRRAVDVQRFTFATPEDRATAYNKYIEEGLKYKSQGDQGDKSAYRRAIQAYLDAARTGEGKVWVPYLNAGNVYKAQGDNKNALKYYDKALAVTPAEPAIWQAKLELYRYDSKKTPREVIEVYEQALEKVVANVNIVTDFAAYLESVGQRDRALDLWEQLAKQFPDTPTYKAEAERLKK